MFSFSSGIRAGAVLCFVATLLSTSTYIRSEPPDRELRCALDDLSRWLDTSESGPGWQAYLKTDELRAQLAKAARADPNVVGQILRRYALGAPETDRARFVRVRRALEQWLTQLPAASIDQLAARARAAKAAFVPRTKADLLDAEADLRAAVARLDARLKIAGPGADQWRSYLKWDAMQEQLSRDSGPELTALDATYDKYAAGHDGLGLIWFDDVRVALRKYLITARAIGDPNLPAQYEAWLDALAEYLEAYISNPTADRATAISSALEWLEEAGQASWLVQSVRYRFSHSNLFGQVSAEVIAAGLANSVDEIQPVRDVILGTDIYGTGHTTGQISAELTPDTRRAQISVMFDGTVRSDTVGYKGPARVYSDGITRLHARKPILIDAEGVGTLPASSEASTRTTIKDIHAGRSCGIVERMAWKRACRQKSQAEGIAALHAQQRLNRRADRQASELVDEAHQLFVGKFRKPLVQRKLFPEQLGFTTTEAALRVTCLQAGGARLGAPSLPPETVEGADLALRTHESMINNLAQAACAGRILKEERFQQIIVELLGSLPERLKSEEDGEPWGITFARRQPVSVAFADDHFSITIRGRAYTKGDNPYPGMNVTALYNINKSEDGFKAVRQGGLQIFPPGFVPGSGRQLSAREQVLRSLLERRFGKMFDKELVLQDLALPGRWSAAGPLALVQWETSSGWLVMAWKQTPPVSRVTAGGLSP